MTNSSHIIQKEAIIPHLLIISFWALLFLFGIINNSGKIGAFISETIGAALNPQTLLLSVALGFVSKYRKFVIACAVAITGNMVFDYYQRREWLEKIGYEVSSEKLVGMVLITGIAMVTISHVVNLFVRWVSSRSQSHG
jgi:hypothetical protein